MTNRSIFVPFLVTLGACAIPGLSMGTTFPSPSPKPSEPSSSSMTTSTPAPRRAEPVATHGWQADAALVAALDDAYRALGFIAENERDLAGSGARGQGASLIEHAARCSTQVQRAIAAGAPAATSITVKGFLGDKTTVTLAAASATICEPLAAKAKTFDARIDQARDAERAKLEAPYRAAGLTGDKLELATSNIVYGVGGIELTPAATKRASIIFVLSDDKTEWTLYRYVFKGDTQAARTEEGFLVRPGPSKFH